MAAKHELDRENVAALLRRYGWNATSFQLLEPEFEYWFADERAAASLAASQPRDLATPVQPACVAYVDTGAAFVAAGAPIAPEERIGEVAAAFTEHARALGKRVCFFAVERRFLRAIGMRSIQIGEQPVFDPQQWTDRQRGHRSLKEQLRRARAKGVQIERIDSAVASDPQSPVRSEIESLIGRWLSSRPMPPMAFLVELHPFGFASERRYYVARTGRTLAGLLVAVPVYLRDGWFFENILRDPRAPNGTAELLVDFAVRDIAGSGCSFATLGLAPLAGDVRWLSAARRFLAGFYSFEGLRAFKAKFRPEIWDPIYLAFPAGRSAFGALYDVLAAFGRRKVVRFAVASVFRAPSFVIRSLAVLLVPWTLMLAIAETQRWFPSRRVQYAWVAFDVVICAALFSLAKRWRQPLAIAAATASACDAAVTTVEAATFNLPRARRFADYALIVVSIAAPLFATAVLVGGIRRRSPRENSPQRRGERGDSQSPLRTSALSAPLR